MRQFTIHHLSRGTLPIHRTGARFTACFRAHNARNVVSQLIRPRKDGVIWISGASGVGKSAFVSGAVIPAWERAIRSGRSNSSVMRLSVRSGESLREFHQRIVVAMIRRWIAPEHPRFQWLLEQALYDPTSAGRRLLMEARRVRIGPNAWILWIDELDRLFIHSAGFGRLGNGFERQLSDLFTFVRAVSAWTPCSGALVSYRDWIHEGLHGALGSNHSGQSVHHLAPVDSNALRSETGFRALVRHYAPGREWDSEAIRWVAREFSSAPQAIALARPYLRAIRSAGNGAPDGEPIKGAQVRAVGGLRGYLATRAECVYRELSEKDDRLPWERLIQRFSNPNHQDGTLDSICLGQIPRGQGEWRLAMELVGRRIFELNGHQVETSRLSPIFPGLLNDWARAARWLEGVNVSPETDIERFDHHARSWIHSRKDPELLLKAPESIDAAKRVLRSEGRSASVSFDTRTFLEASIVDSPRRGWKSIPARLGWIGGVVAILGIVSALLTLNAKSLQGSGHSSGSESSIEHETVPGNRTFEYDNVDLNQRR